VLTDAERDAARALLAAQNPADQDPADQDPAEQNPADQDPAAATLGPRPVLLLPGAGMPVKRWPRERWQQLVDDLREQGRSVLTVPDGAELRGVRVLPAQDLRGLAAVAAVLAELGGVGVGGDTGPVRLATAAGLPAVGLYGPTLGIRYGLSDPASRSLQGLPECPVRRPTAITEQECWWSARCPLTADHAPACMADLSVERVRDALRGVGGTAAPAALEGWSQVPGRPGRVGRGHE
jgi:ADP-heptose:LPS heptosyltransferase